MEGIISIILSLITTLIVIAISWGKLTQGFTDLKERFDKFEDKIDKGILELTGRIGNVEGALGVRYKTSTSPIHLTEEGERVLTESGAKEIVNNPENKQEILNKILIEPKPTNAYDAQEKTRQIIKKMADNSMFVSLKKYAFDKGLNLENLLDITAIYFRKYVLEELEFKVEDLDNR